MKTVFVQKKKAHKRNAPQNRKLVFLAAGVILLAALSGCDRIKAVTDRIRGRGTAAAPAAGAPGGALPVSAPQAAVFAVNTIIAAQGQIQDYIALSGDIVAGSTVDTYSEAAGKITSVYVTVGQRVTRGTAIASVDPSKPGLDYRQSVATAPIAGTIVSLPAQVGMTISQAVPLARISGSGALELRLYVAERFISKMALNLPCEITLDAWPGEVFQGSISEVAPTVDPMSRTMEAKVNVNNPGSKLKAGMFAKVRIITERKDNIVKIPASAVVSRFGEQYVFTVEQDPANPAGKVVRRRTVTAGILVDGVMEIQRGLSPGEEIVVRGQSLLEDGARVNIIDRTAPLGD